MQTCICSLAGTDACNRCSNRMGAVKTTTDWESVEDIRERTLKDQTYFTWISQHPEPHTPWRVALSQVRKDRLTLLDHIAALEERVRVLERLLVWAVPILPESECHWHPYYKEARALTGGMQALAASGEPAKPEPFTAEDLARAFHKTYEQLAPEFGYVTREDTRTFDPTSPNGQLMIAVCDSLLRPAASGRERG